MFFKKRTTKRKKLYLTLLFSFVSEVGIDVAWIVLVLEKWNSCIMHFIHYDGINRICPRCLSFLHCRCLQLNLFVCAIIVDTDIVNSVIHLTKCRYNRAYAMNSVMYCLITSADLHTVSGKVSQGILLRSR